MQQQQLWALRHCCLSRRCSSCSRPEVGQQLPRRSSLGRLWSRVDDDDDDDYDEDDLDSGSDFFTGNSRPDYEDFDTEYNDYYDSDYDNLDGESFDYATGKKRKKKGKKKDGTFEKVMSYTPIGMAKNAIDRRNTPDRVEERDSRRKARVEARMSKKTAKTDEIKSRNELTKSMAQPDNTAQILASLQDPAAGTRSTTETGAKKGLSTGAIIGIAVGSLALLGLAAYLILKKKK